MANVTISPNMNLTIPTVSLDPGPDWAFNINASLTAIDSHDHTSGKGVAIPSSGLNINSDLPFNNNNATTLRSVRFQPQPTNIINPTDIGTLYEVGVDLYYNDGAGNIIRITQSGAVTGAAGTITGLPSGTASASYNSVSGTFEFKSSTGIAANIDVASIVLRNFVAGSFGLTLSPPLAMTSNFNITLPNTPPVDSFMTISTVGDMAGSVPLSQGITGSMIAAGTITASNIAPGVLNTLKNITFLANGSFIAPAGVTTLVIAGSGGGGGGGAGASLSGPGFATGYAGGGGSGAVSSVFVCKVTPGNAYAVIVGAGGIRGVGVLGGSGSAGQDGGTSSFTDDQGTFIFIGGLGGGAGLQSVSGSFGAGGDGAYSGYTVQNQFRVNGGDGGAGTSVVTNGSPGKNSWQSNFVGGTGGTTGAQIHGGGGGGAGALGDGGAGGAGFGVGGLAGTGPGAGGGGGAVGFSTTPGGNGGFGGTGFITIAYVGA